MEKGKERNIEKEIRKRREKGAQRRDRKKKEKEKRERMKVKGATREAKRGMRHREQRNVKGDKSQEWHPPLRAGGQNCH